MSLRGPFLPERNLALFLDIDGTLLEIAPTPDAASVPAALRNTLRLAAERENGALALVSGRTLREIDRLFWPLTFPASGQHGFEFRNAIGEVATPHLPPGLLDTARLELGQLAHAHKGLLLEDKGTSLAMHYRLAPMLAGTVREAIGELARWLHPLFVVREGKCVVELGPAGHSKRTAVEAFMREAPFSGRIPLYFGDDVTDEDGFAAVNAMGGHSICVGNRTHTCARHRMASVSAVVGWLRERNLGRFSVVDRSRHGS
jgi:trehalose 6-phosphate phosphatase